jgi:hypothetical protein
MASRIKYPDRITIPMSTALRAELEAEAWECEMGLADYVRGLLVRRGKWARTVGTAGGYDIAAPELAKRVQR